MTLKKIVSGGQTGVDRAALDWALEAGIECGGWCPSGRRAEDGIIDARYPLVETPGEQYSQRTEWNVRDSDGTLLLTVSAGLSGGTELTRKFARKWNRPCLQLSRLSRDTRGRHGEEAPPEGAGELLRNFMEANRIEILNVAGPRESTEPGCGKFVREVLDEAFLSD